VRVLHVIPWPVFGGPHNEALVIARHAPAHRWEVIAVLPPDATRAAERLRGAGVAVRELRLVRLRRTKSPVFWLLFPIRFVADVLSLVRVIHSDGIAVVDGSSVNLQAALAARLAGVACVWRIADVSAPKAIRQLVALAVQWLAHEVLVNGSATIDAYPALRRSRVPLSVYYPMIDDGAYRPGKETTSGGPFLVGTVANINPDKGIDVFVQAAAQLTHRPDVSFVIVGSEHESHRSYADAVRRRAAELGADRVLFAGSQTDVATWMRRMDVFVISSRREGTTTTIIEAMASGLAIVATRVGAIDELITDGNTGLLVSPEDFRSLATKVASLLGDPDLRAALGHRARAAYLSRFTLERSLTARLAAYERVLTSRGCPA
jgi:glycosyltransferase involved in cell wall biosynthesis